MPPRRASVMGGEMIEGRRLARDVCAQRYGAARKLSRTQGTEERAEIRVGVGSIAKFGTFGVIPAVFPPFHSSVALLRARGGVPTECEEPRR